MSGVGATTHYCNYYDETLINAKVGYEERTKKWLKKAWDDSEGRYTNFDITQKATREWGGEMLEMKLGRQWWFDKTRDGKSMRSHAGDDAEDDDGLILHKMTRGWGRGILERRMREVKMLETMRVWYEGKRQGNEEKGCCKETMMLDVTQETAREWQEGLLLMMMLHTNYCWVSLSR